MNSTHKATLAIVTIALLASACEKQAAPKTEAQDKQITDIAAQPAPNAVERTTAEAANEAEQVAAPVVPFTTAELAAGLRAPDVPNPATSLSTAAIRTTSGEPVGEVHSVIVGANGKADAIILDVGGVMNVGEHAVSIQASEFTYLKERNILVVKMAKADIEKLPTMQPPKS
jgi:hypothetical protein